MEHGLVKETADRVTRTDKKQHFSEKVAKVESILAQDAEGENMERPEAKKSSTFGVIEGDAQSDDRWFWSF